MSPKNEALFKDSKGPIECFSWGRFVVGGQEHSDSGGGEVGAGKDIRLVGSEVTPWKERKGHRLKRSMVTGVYDKDVQVLVIGNGVYGALEVPEKVKKDVAKHGIRELRVELTPDACRAYNELCREGKRVALLAHGTC